MTYTSHVSIIVSDLEAHPSMPRLMQSIARQSTGLECVEIVVAGHEPHPESTLSAWRAITDSDDITLLTLDREATPSRARNAAVAATTGDLLLFLRPDYRIDPKYLITALPLFENNPDVDILYPDYIRLAPKRASSGQSGLVQLPDFDEHLLQAQNFIGPAVMVRREAWDDTVGFRDNTVYRDWDMWVQLAATGHGFFHVNYPLASCEHAKITFRERAEDGRRKAMLVINNQSFFHMHTVRWALSYLRGNAWAQAGRFMTIPSPIEVTRMIQEHAMHTMGTDVLTREAIRQFENSPQSIEARN
ncbi:glycosyltransferase [Pseudodesulfovibrio sp.]|uniref:glycosyltransferase n=1 Tax=unclassified Pseudodesulfovibrio TaxID=2661612 RepID=UPI003B00145F